MMVLTSDIVAYHLNDGEVVCKKKMEEEDFKKVVFCITWQEIIDGYFTYVCDRCEKLITIDDIIAEANPETKGEILKEINPDVKKKGDVIKLDSKKNSKEKK